jgi:MFS family permease
MSAVIFFGCSIGTALAPNLPAFFAFRALTALQGTTFLIVGASCLADIYKPTERATAMGLFLSGTLIGPAFGPFIGGIIVTFKSWRVIFWLQSALGGLASICIYFLLPETIHYKRADELKGLSTKQQAGRLWEWTNPMRVIRLYRYPNLMTVVCHFDRMMGNTNTWEIRALLLVRSSGTCIHFSRLSVMSSIRAFIFLLLCSLVSFT